ncbi:dGTPase [Glaciecola punicea ACAM 611]|uniref:dGTPase n=1 Tax=Glaciecola punicea ACAM 611 TaxID=1121923 RepID=H5TBN5_9ALTE|nr:dGTPase [Glaciecola punicea]GAB55712.1 dGTPase [Glaciecola punicea ACAM 611]
MNYKSKLQTQRFSSSSVAGRDFNEEMESDRGRAIHSPALRRLQQKTQVFPLETNAAVRSRLTHSMEVQQVGRYIAKQVLKVIDKQNLAEQYGLKGKFDGFISAVEIACLLHDVGNPPFGHLGEEAINKWAISSVVPIFVQNFGDACIDNAYVRDIKTFEGNAQGLRVLHSLQSLNLTYTQLACLLKYTGPACDTKPEQGSKFAYRQKKPGYYLSEKEIVDSINEALDIAPGCRFPLTYIMEAADDIAYCIADLDDALDKGLISVPELHGLIKHKWEKHCEAHFNDNSARSNAYLLDISQSALEKYHKAEFNKSHQYILSLRTRLINDLSEYATARYIDNHAAIFDGRFDEPLLKGNNEFAWATKTLKNIAVERVFSTKEVQRLEVKGFNIIVGLLNIYTPLLNLSGADFRTLIANKSIKGAPLESRLFQDLPGTNIRRYHLCMDQLTQRSELNDNLELLELYYRARIVIDYVSGMTDHFALSEYRELTAIS